VKNSPSNGDLTITHLLMLSPKRNANNSTPCCTEGTTSRSRTQPSRGAFCLERRPTTRFLYTPTNQHCKITKIPGAACTAEQPHCVDTHWTVQHDGMRITKFRLTQDLSFTSNKMGSIRSIISQVDMGAYAEIIYGWCQPRILHFIVLSLRTQHPKSRILISKYNYRDAYRRIAHSVAAALQTIVILRVTACLALRLTLGVRRTHKRGDASFQRSSPT
jgi:hypothetical protein